VFKISQESLGKFKIYCLSDAKENNCVKFALEKGATISDLRLKGQDIYDGYNNFEDLDALTWAKGILLAPFPNRLKEGKYSFEGKEYQFPINDTKTSNALHGFISQLEFSIEKVEANNTNATVICSTTYNGNYDYYPFPFLAEVKYSLDEKSGFSFCFSITNIGESNMPIGLGWHPYFSLSENVDNTTISLPKLKKIEIDENMLPNGKKTPFNDFRYPTKLNEMVFDNCFLLDLETEFATVVLEGEKGRLFYRQKSKNPYLQIFTPPHRNSIALEPMTCNIDAFNNKEGLQILKPRQTIMLECSLNLEV
jgi:aldose 1-epimerase